MNVGNKIREIRLEKGLTQKTLGERCGIAEPTIRKYELGSLNPKYETVAKIAKALGVSTASLIGEEDQLNNILKTATKSVQDQNAFEKAILEAYGREAMDILDNYAVANYKRQALMWSFSQTDEQTMDLYYKYTQLDNRGKKTVQNVILSEFEAIKK